MSGCPICTLSSHRDGSDVPIARLGLWDCHEPVTDFNTPTAFQIHTMIRFITESLSDGRPVGVSCGVGPGRTGTVLACYLVIKGYDATRAMNEIRIRRPGSIETENQEDAVRAFADSHGEW
jgi:atypical dual specificity phosphatase